MAENSGIQWTTHSFNPWRGCTKVSAGCKNCYAETLSGRNPGVLGMWGPNGTRVVAAEAQWKLPVKWEGGQRLNPPVHAERPRVFCASLADIFEDWTGPMVGPKGDVISHDSGDPPWRELGAGRRITMQDVRNRLFRLIDATPNLDWLLLTKRPENIAKMMPEYVRTSPSTNYFYGDEAKRRGVEPGKGIESTMSVSGVGVVRPNLWLGASVENQQAADERIPHLLRVPAAVRFLSVEPLLGPIQFPLPCKGSAFWTGIHWLIVGGESGPGARPCRVEWIRSIVEQCKAAGVPCFTKQMGGNVITRNDMVEDGFNNDESGWPEHDIHGFREEYQGADCRIRLRDKKGGEMSEWPADLRVREFPKAVA